MTYVVTSIDLSSLPEPAIVEILSFEAMLDDLVDDIAARFADAGVDYDVGNLETDPAKIIAEAVTYRKTLLRARINDAAKANLLAKSTSSDLDHLVAFYGVTRLDGEDDTRLRARTVLAITGRSTAGPEEWYEYHAMSADVRVRQVRVHRIGGGPQIGVAILSSEDGGVPDQPMLDAVEAAVTSRAVKVVSDVVVVTPAVQQAQDVTAQVWLLPDAPMTVFEGLEDALRAAWEAETGIGFDMTLSWLTAKLHAAGVADVAISEPAASVVVDDTRAIALGEVDLTFMGRRR